MKKQQTFTVVVIDDKDKCCEQLKNKLRGSRHIIVGDTAVSIAVETVHVRVRREEKAERPETDSWTFQNEMVSQLLVAAQAKPHLLIVDYIYIDDQVAKFFKEKAKKTQVDKEEVHTRALTPYDLRKWVEDCVEIDSGDKTKIIKGLFGFNGPLYLHTYTPYGLDAAAGTITERERNTSLAFPSAQITVIDTRSEFFNNDQFDPPHPDEKSRSFYDKDYYPYQLAIFFDQVLQKEIYKQAFASNRHVRLIRTSYAVSIICAVGAAVGFASSWAGGLILEFLRSNRFVEAVFLCVLCLGSMLIAGFSLTMWFETLMKRLIGEE